VLEAVAGEDEVAVIEADKTEADAVEELVFGEMTPPWTLTGAVLFVVFAAAATKAPKESPDVLVTKSELYRNQPMGLLILEYSRRIDHSNHSILAMRSL
jgi:hypothetical protein